MRRSMLIVLGIVLALLLAAGAAVWFFVVQLGPASASTDDHVFVVLEGEGVQTIAEGLKADGFIKSARAMTIYVWLERLGSDLKAGEYFLSSSLDTPEIVRMLVSGSVEGKERVIRTLEGWSNAEIGAYLDEQGLFSTEVWLEAAGVTDSRTLLPKKAYAFLSEKPTTASLEGYLFPDTYRVFRDATPAEVVEKMLDNFREKVDDKLIADINAKGETLFTVLTLASIVEKEVFLDADRKKVADIFWKRLSEGIPLQSDATINYITGKGRTRSTLEDLVIESPYNTYLHAGLPQGPIGSPGLASIKAVVNPEPNPYYYFLTTEDGVTIFSRTFEEHKANKAKYLD